MASSKLSIALDPAVAAGARAQAQREGTSLSAWLNRAAERELRLADGLAAVAEFEAEEGPFTADERRAASALADWYGVGVDREDDATSGVRAGVGGSGVRGGGRPCRRCGSVSGVTYDAGALIAAERRDRALWAPT